MTRNWSQIKDDMIKGELGKVYCQGRIPKDKRLEMQEELFKRCEDNAIVRPTNVESESKDRLNQIRELVINFVNQLKEMLGE